MSRYHSASSYPPSGIADASIHEAGTRADLQRHDRDPSPSGSDSSSAFNNYADNPIDDAPAPDDPYHALTSQTLNADGTPKRPMNAFMIFARKRRPQISAANQMMRTGDVSKILSKEWNSMEMSEKKFYLDQAKKLKDNFNSKYPDYVYRRRPNNSRKKRKAEPNHDDPNDAHLADPDDPAYDDQSPIDGDDPLMVPSPQDVQYTRAHPLNPSPPLYHPHEPMPHASNPACTYPYSSDFHPRLPQPHSDPTLSSTIGPIRTSSLDSVGALSYHSHQHPPHSLYQNPSHAHTSHLYAAQHNPHGHPHAHAHGGLAGWEPTRRADPPRSNNWPVLLPALDTNLARHQRSIASASLPSGLAAATANGTANGSGKPADAYSPSPSVPARPWSSSTSASSSSSAASASASASVSASHSHYGSASHPHPHPNQNQNQNQNPNAFPTLNSAFFPHESPASKAMDIAASPALPPSSSSDYYSATLSSTGVGVGIGMGAAAGRRTSQETPYGNANPLGWGQAQYGRSGPGSGSGSGSGLHALSPYSLHASTERGGSGSGTGAGSGTGSGAHLGYWDDRFGGR